MGVAISISEFDLIKKYFQGSQSAEEVVFAIGDDCAVVQPPEGKQLVLSMDTLVEGVHFHARAPIEWVAYRALASCVSDLAAMGASPSHFTLGLTLPEADESWLANFSQGLFEAANDFGITLVGGDTTKGPLTISIQVHGWVQAGKALMRSGAKIGDLIYVSHFLGDAAKQLEEVLLKPEVAKPKQYYFPQPRLKLGQALVGLASACLDISDGLLADLNHICVASGCGAKVDTDKLPLNELADQQDTTDAKRLALTGGDDYELCFTVGAQHRQQVNSLLMELNLSGGVIGEIVPGSGVELLGMDTVSIDKQSNGYQHFK